MKDYKSLSVTELLDLLDGPVLSGDEYGEIFKALQSHGYPGEERAKRLVAIVSRRAAEILPEGSFKHVRIPEDMKDVPTAVLIEVLCQFDFDSNAFGDILDELAERECPSPEIEQRMMEIVRRQMKKAAQSSPEKMAAMIRVIPPDDPDFAGVIKEDLH